MRSTRTDGPNRRPLVVTAAACVMAIACSSRVQEVAGSGDGAADTGAGHIVDGAAHDSLHAGDALAAGDGLGPADAADGDAMDAPVDGPLTCDAGVRSDGCACEPKEGGSCTFGGKRCKYYETCPSKAVECSCWEYVGGDETGTWYTKWTCVPVPCP